MSEHELMPRVSVLDPQDGELLPAGPVVHRVLEDGSTTGGRAGLVECRMPPGWGGPPQHIHHAHDESFFVLTGRVRFRSGSTEHVLGPGSTFVAGMGTPHTFGNADPDEPASLLLVVTPERYIGYFRELQHLRPGPDGMLVPAEILALMARYATEPYSPS
ncbi:cupin domain-containing protein [Amnibacterium sp. CER49]|uniref:cupin domain-containing protein n=1 Tax=Amnibacterium sp. CER49 TaxID=3039161 RepID=UPI0024493B71|nr:cupin domain-containing protein [Amnibacterium sp. CER49]MDH2443451.1 cupin domain-containing protein [Amnibacterium sp. CER49]